jgi:ABC-type Fe3+-siderophore transport system permease subunit
MASILRGMKMNEIHYEMLMQKRLKQVLTAFFVGCALFVVVVYAVAPSIYVTALTLPASPTERYPLYVTLFLLALLAFIAVMIVGVVRHWRWLFWLLLLAFGFSILELPATVLQLTGVIPDSYPVWYSLSRLGVALLQSGIAIWMFQVYRRYGVWALGKRVSRHA